MSDTSRDDGSFKLTGRHVFLILLTFFGLIIAVNVTMATLAAGTWPGLVVANSYVESQRFNERVAAAREQQALGYALSFVQARDQLSLTLTDADGKGVEILGGTVRIGRPVTRTEDRLIDVPAAPSGAVSMPDALADGLWVADVALTLADGRVWRYETRFSVSEGK
ncbi:FixH family protein [Thalassobaculum sp.]|jgi:nitrogen fixation protein FixH|uniref:FixH family protein n=1 Tax=Thalassobaculum sp. TaxID=2022740 RepID=UPI003B5943CB